MSTPYSLYFNGLAPLDLRDLLAESTFCAALSLRTLKAIFGDPFPLRPYHFNSLTKLCVNLEEIIVSGNWEGEPVSGITSLKKMSSKRSFRGKVDRLSSSKSSHNFRGCLSSTSLIPGILESPTTCRYLLMTVASFVPRRWETSESSVVSVLHGIKKFAIESVSLSSSHSSRTETRK